MKISIVTVAYNSAATLVDTLRSVATQTHADIEHILIDGASTDATLSLARQHGVHLSHVVSEPDAGIYEAMNKGLALATGDFVGFLNADDVYTDRHVVSRLNRAASPSNVDAVYGDLVYVDRHAPDRVVRYWRSGCFSRRSLSFGWMPPHPTLYLRRSRVAEIGGFDTRLGISADYDFMLRYLSVPGLSVAYVPEVLVNMRLGGASNRSFSALVQKAREDMTVLKRHQVGGWPTLLAKMVRKLPQFISRPPART